MSNSCIYHFEDLIGYCKTCRFFICSVCLTDHLEHLAQIIIIKNINQKIINFYDEIKKLNLQKQSNISQIKALITNVRLKCIDYLKSIEDQIIKQQEMHIKMSSTYKYLKLLNFLKQKEYNGLENIDFQKIYDSIEKDKIGFIKDQNDRQSIKINKLIQNHYNNINQLLSYFNQKQFISDYSENLEIAQKQFNSKSYQKSCASFNKAFTQIFKYQVKYKKYLEKYGEALKKQNSLQQAEKIYQRLLIIDPINKDYNYNIGIIYTNFGKYPVALEYLTKAQTYENNSLKLIQMKAQCYQNLKQYDKCLEQCEKLLKKNPNDQNYINKKNNITKKLSQFKKVSVSSMEKSIPVIEDINLLFNQAQLYQQSKNYEKAIQKYNKIIELKPKQSFYYYQKAKLQYLLKKYENSIVSYGNAIKFSPNNSQYHHQKFKILFELKQYGSALIEINNTIEINKNNPLYYQQQGLTYEALNQQQKALQSYQKCLKIKADNSEVWFRKGQILRIKQKYVQSLECYQNAVKLKGQKHYIQERDKMKILVKKKNFKCL